MSSLCIFRQAAAKALLRPAAVLAPLPATVVARYMSTQKQGPGMLAGEATEWDPVFKAYAAPTASATGHTINDYVDEVEDKVRGIHKSYRALRAAERTRERALRDEILAEMSAGETILDYIDEAQDQVRQGYTTGTARPRSQ